MQISFEFRNARLVSRSMEALRRETPRIARSRIYEALKKLVKKMKRYPAMRPGQRYVRTNRLKRSWRIKKKGRMGYTVSNRASYRGRVYPKFVVGDATGANQAWMHQGRWRILRWEMEMALERLPKAASDHVHFFVRRYGWEAG